MKKLMILAAFVLTFALSVNFAFAEGAIQHNDCSSVPYPLAGYTGCNFGFFDGNGTSVTYQPSFYHDVLTPSGNETEVFEGVVANNTGKTVIYSANSGSPVTPNQTCYSFVTKDATLHWQLVINATGDYTLVCIFHK